MNAGDTVLIPLPDTSYGSHLWMVISDPGQGDECVIVNFTAWRADKDQACVVEPGMHPYVTKRTCRDSLQPGQSLRSTSGLGSGDRRGGFVVGSRRLGRAPSKTTWMC